MSETGTLNYSERRDFQPQLPLQMGPIYQRPFRAAALFKWLFAYPGYLLSWYRLWVYGVTVLFWLYLTPDMATMQTFSADWIAALFFRNLTYVVLFVGALHVWLYSRKSQGTEYKYNSDWPATGDSTFLFNSQLWDNVFWTLCSGVPLWTAYEVLTYWMQANGFAPVVSWQAHPIYCLALLLLLPLWIQVHFYFTHRLLHWQPFYRHAHHVHHRNVNYGPWSGISMHPIEHLVFYSGLLLLWVIPSHPVHIIYYMLVHGGSAAAHIGFHQVRLGGDKKLDVDNYMHYLHHKYVNVNYGNDRAVLPIDNWLGTFHDGSPEAHEAMKKRARERILRARRKADGAQ